MYLIKALEVADYSGGRQIGRQVKVLSNIYQNKVMPIVELYYFLICIQSITYGC
jgi:hypothetical protein